MVGRERKLLAAEIRKLVAEESAHFDDPKLHRSEIEQRVRDRLARRYGDDNGSPTWLLIIQLLLRLLPLLLEDPKSNLDGALANMAASDAAEPAAEE